MSIEAIGLSNTFMCIAVLTLIASLVAFGSPLWKLVGHQHETAAL